MKSFTSNGFSLLELMVVITISGLLSLALYSIFKQSSRSVTVVTHKIDMDEALLLLYNQLDKDISAACVPLLAHQEITKKEKEKKEKTKGAEEPAKEEKTEAIPTIKKVFFGQTRKDLLHTFTCITTHTMSNYNAVKPKIARVVYRLESESLDTVDKPSYKLLRQEIYDLTTTELESSSQKSYELIGQLKNLKIFFIAQKKHDKENNKEEEKKPEEKIEFTTETQWSSDESSVKNHIFLPGYVRFEGERWNNQYTSTTPFAFEYKIVATGEYQKEELLDQPENSTSNKNQAPSQTLQLTLAKAEQLMNKIMSLPVAV